MKFRQIDNSPQTFILVFETEEELAGGLLQFTREQKPFAASFKIVGALSSARLAWFSWESKRYEPSVMLDEQVENTPGSSARKSCTLLPKLRAVLVVSTGLPHAWALIGLRSCLE